MAFVSGTAAPARVSSRCSAFTSARVLNMQRVHPKSLRRVVLPTMIVSEVNSPSELKDVLEEAGDNLVVIDYSTTWCGPCKIIAPKFEQMSEDHDDVVFLKVMGDKDGSTADLMKEQGISAVPAFHFWKQSKKVHTITGARANDIEEAITSYK